MAEQQLTSTADSPALGVSGLTKRYGSLTVLDRLSFDAPGGSIVALLGPNGAGKTTTFKCVLGVARFQGDVHVAGVSVRDRGKDARRLIGYLPQTPAFNDADTCRQALEFLAELKGAPAARAGDLLGRVALADRCDWKVGTLSGGMRQRLALAAALLADPPLVLLDEPTANMDLESREQFREMLRSLKAEGKTILLSTHMVDSLEDLADRVLLLKDGRLVYDGALQDIISARTASRVVVNLNGTDRSAFMGVLEDIGIHADRVTPAGQRLEDILAALAGDEKTEPSS